MFGPAAGDLGRLDPAMEALIENLELLGRRDKAALLKVCQVDEEDLADMVSKYALSIQTGL